MNDGEALFRAVLDYPEEDTPRLMYADWLEENGQGERAEFIRVQCELATCGPCPATVYHLSELAPEEHPWKRGGSPIIKEKKPCGWCPVCDLRRRERELFPRIADGLASVWPSRGWRFDTDPSVTADVPLAVVSRGWVSEIRLPLASLMGGPCPETRPSGKYPEYPRCVSHCETCGGGGSVPGVTPVIFGAQPVTRVVLSDREPDERWWWWRDDGAGTYRNNRAYLPPAVFQRMLKLGQQSAPGLDGHGVHFDTRDLALAALNDALVAYGRVNAAGWTHECPGCKSCLMGPCLVCKGKGSLPGLPPLRPPTK